MGIFFHEVRIIVPVFHAIGKQEFEEYFDFSCPFKNSDDKSFETTSRVELLSR